MRKETIHISTWNDFSAFIQLNLRSQQERNFYDRVCSIKRVLGPFIPPALCFSIVYCEASHLSEVARRLCEKVNSSDRFWICLKINLFKNKNWFPIPTRFDCEPYLGIGFQRTWNPANFFRENAHSAVKRADLICKNQSCVYLQHESTLFSEETSLVGFHTLHNCLFLLLSSSSF